MVSATQLSALSFPPRGDLPDDIEATCCFPTIFSGAMSRQRQNANLETMFYSQATAVDLMRLPKFQSYLSPNEGGARAVSSHLSKQRGLLVSTGTERSFFDLALSNLKRCEGLVVRDFNPSVKAYVDFNTLLLRIAKDRQDYVRLSTLSPNVDIDSPQYRQKIDEIWALMEDASIPPPIKQYYRQHLRAFARVYFRETKGDMYWRSRGGFDGVKYYEDDKLFNKLQQYAKSGNIIATVGPIDDLVFLDGRTIATLDVSNIPDYFILNIQTQSKPTIITTCVDRERTQYTSSTYQKLDHQQQTELARLLEVGLQIFQSYGYTSLEVLGQRPLTSLLKGSSAKPPKINTSVYSKQLLRYLRAHKDRHWVQIGNEWVDFNNKYNYVQWAQSFTRSDFSLEECRVLQPFLPILLSQDVHYTSPEVREELLRIPDRLKVAKNQ